MDEDVDARMREKFEELLMQSGEESLSEIRKLIYITGLPEPTEHERTAANPDTLRGRVWRKLLRVDVNAEHYIDCINGIAPIIADPSHPHHEYLKSFYLGSRKDSDRVTGLWVKHADPELRKSLLSRLAPSRILRLMTAFAVHCADMKTRPTFYQGLCRSAAMFLHEMPEAAAFDCFCRLYNSHLRLTGVEGYRMARVTEMMLRICLWISDRELCENIGQHLSVAASHLFLHTAHAPFAHVQQLWDIFLAWGMHLNVIISVARLVNDRSRIIQDTPERTLTSNLFNQIDKPDIMLDLLVPMLKDYSSEVLDMLWYHLRHPEFTKSIKTFHESVCQASGIKSLTLG